MRKGKKGRKLSRKRDQRKALLKSLARSLILKEKIKITEAKAKELRVFVEKLITLAKPADLSAQRKLLKVFRKNLTQKLIKEIAPRYKKREGGYLSIVKLGRRKSDGAKMVQIRLIE